MDAYVNSENLYNYMEFLQKKCPKDPNPLVVNSALKHIQRKLYREDKRCKDKKNTLVALEILYAENHGDFMDIIGFFMWVLITSENLKFFQCHFKILKQRREPHA
ncbi:hypothetical protein MRB53_018388 [Persea americana]|uniref:Uncharacterized protein n=1 Tax=Persea americana TaxID=3435 RepID=A0ACC2M7N0_PERAE|nr:hypothetical protein MRB53_018388 [Persea americana]